MTKNRISIKKVNILGIFLSSCFLLSLVTASAQKKGKKALTRTDYHKWHFLVNEALSENGKWASYRLQYDSGPDTLILQQVPGHRRFILPEYYRPSFAGEQWFTAQTKGQVLLLIDLSSGKKQILKGISQHSFTPDLRHLILLYTKGEADQKLIIHDLRKKDSLVFKNVISYTYNKKANAIAIVKIADKGEEVQLFSLNSPFEEKSVFLSQNRPISEITWNKSGTALAFLLEANLPNDTGRIVYYRTKDRKHYIFNPVASPNFDQENKLISTWDIPLKISLDGNRIFFGVKRKKLVKDTSLAKIWHTNDKYIYPASKGVPNWVNHVKVGYWNPETSTYFQISDNTMPKMLLNEKQTHALVYDPAHYEPQTEIYTPLDIYLLELSSKKSKLILKKHAYFQESMTMSPEGRYVVYYKEGDWWVYDIDKDLHRNLTNDIGISFSHKNTYNGLVPYGSVGWSEGDDALLLYGQYDLWRIPASGGKAERITHGREKKVVYRLISKPEAQQKMSNYDGVTLGSYDMHQPLFFSMEQGDLSGYAIKEWKEPIKTILMENAYTSQAKISKNGRAVTFLKEQYDQPPQLMYYNAIDQKTSHMLFQSNPHAKKYAWGFSKKIGYHNSRGEQLSGVLCYPVGYQKDKKYPMIVKVYEKLSDQLNHYVNPTLLNGNGFNRTNLTSKGYFVFLPDIIYQIGNTGYSALDCITSGTKAAIREASIDSSRVGLTGHSFGGYETLFTITQTNLFATAIAGAGIADLPRSYLTITDGENVNFSRYEHDQPRMGKSLFEDFEGYLENSALLYAEDMNIPLLTWTGEADFHVDYYQSIEFYMAMRRLGKINTLLLYPGEGHILIQPRHQKHMTKCMEEWFDHYLKGAKKQDWMQ